MSVDLTFRPVVEIDLGALRWNYRRLAAAAPGAEAAAVVKCDGYGLGAAEVARALARAEGCRTFFVAYPDEGAALRAALDHVAPAADIYVFNGPDVGSLDVFDSARLKPVLNSLEQARLWATARRGSAAALHIDTGMNRAGAPYTELAAIARLEGLALDLVMSHLACSSSPAHPVNRAQLEAFEAASRLFPGVRRSLAASSGALLPPAFHFDMTRLGVGVYGASPLDDAQAAPMRAVATLTAPVVQLRDVEPGAFVGYGATKVFDAPQRLAVVQLGYGDGYLRAAGNRGAAYLAGGRRPIVGRVSMDMITLDVTEAAQPVRVGDRAEFFGRNLPIEDAAAACGTLPYELLTGLGARIVRRYVGSLAPIAAREAEGSA